MSVDAGQLIGTALEGVIRRQRGEGGWNARPPRADPGGRFRWVRGPATTCRRTGRWASASRSWSKICVGSADAPPAAVRPPPSAPCSS